MTTPKTVPVAAVIRALKRASDVHAALSGSQREEGLYRGSDRSAAIAGTLRGEAVDIIRSVAARGGRKGKVRRGK